MEVTFHSFQKLKGMSRRESGVREAAPGRGTGRSQGLGAGQKPQCARPGRLGPSMVVPEGQPCSQGCVGSGSLSCHLGVRPDPFPSLGEAGRKESSPVGRAASER